MSIPVSGCVHPRISRPTPNMLSAQMLPMNATPHADLGILNQLPNMPTRMPRPSSADLRDQLHTDDGGEDGKSGQQDEGRWREGRRMARSRRLRFCTGWERRGGVEVGHAVALDRWLVPNAAEDANLRLPPMRFKPAAIGLPFSHQSSPGTILYPRPALLPNYDALVRIIGKGRRLLWFNPRGSPRTRGIFGRRSCSANHVRRCSRRLCSASRSRPGVRTGPSDYPTARARKPSRPSAPAATNSSAASAPATRPRDGAP